MLILSNINNVSSWELTIDTVEDVELTIVVESKFSPSLEVLSGRYNGSW